MGRRLREGLGGLQDVFKAAMLNITSKSSLHLGLGVRKKQGEFSHAAGAGAGVVGRSLLDR